ncbi:MAG TPA: hypothetical protein VHA30_00420 [Patescibacteria group bacterium]|nr:hypothetical protein [Patescibacteria group bacterium]
MSLADIQNLYLEFLNNFPASTRPVISILAAILLVYSLFKVVRKDWIYLIALILLLPGSKPILENIWQAILALVKFLLNTK